MLAQTSHKRAVRGKIRRSLVVVHALVLELERSMFGDERLSFPLIFVRHSSTYPRGINNRSQRKNKPER